MTAGDDSDTLARTRGPRSASAIADILKPPIKPALVVDARTETKKTEEGESESFDPENTDYKACGWAGNRTLPSLRIILKDGSEKGCLYAHLDSQCPADGCEFIPSVPGRKGNIIRLRIAGHTSVFMVILEGVRLRRVWELIMAHQTPWIHELPTDVHFRNDNDPVIKSIAFKPVKVDAGGD